MKEVMPNTKAKEISTGNKVENKNSNIDYKNAKDLELAQLSGKGDMFAFEEIYNRHSRRVHSLCLRMLQNAPDAEDLMQDVFIHLHRKIGSFRGDSAFTTWLHRFTINQVLMYLRKRNGKKNGKKNEVQEEQITPDGEKHNIIANVPDTKTLKVEQKNTDLMTMEKAIDQLPEGYRNVFVLHDIEGYDHEEVARILGISVGTSKSQLFKARLKLRRLIEKQANPKLSEKKLIELDSLYTTKNVKLTDKNLTEPVNSSINILEPAIDIKKIQKIKKSSKTFIKDSSKIFQDRSETRESYPIPKGRLAPASKESSGSILGVDLTEFRRLRNQLSKQQNLALELIYERKMNDYGDAQRLADMLECEVNELGKIIKSARENFEKLKNNKG